MFEYPIRMVHTLIFFDAYFIALEEPLNKTCLQTSFYKPVNDTLGPLFSRLPNIKSARKRRKTKASSQFPTLHPQPNPPPKIEHAYSSLTKHLFFFYYIFHASIFSKQ